MMARSLAVAILAKGNAAFSAARTSFIAPAFFFRSGARYSTTCSNDPNTHEDFRPTSKLASSGISLKDVVEQDIKKNPVVIYMKGVPDLPQCRFSDLAVTVLKIYRVHIEARNILEDLELKNAVKEFSNWPTFPQIFINGEFIGGFDILHSMHKTGELERKMETL